MNFLIIAECAKLGALCVTRNATKTIKGNKNFENDPFSSEPTLNRQTNELT